MSPPEQPRESSGFTAFILGHLSLREGHIRVAHTELSVFCSADIPVAIQCMQNGLSCRCLCSL